MNQNRDIRPQDALQVGDLLFASCSAEVYGKVVEIDWENTQCTVHVFNVSRLVESPFSYREPGKAEDTDGAGIIVSYIAIEDCWEWPADADGGRDYDSQHVWTRWGVYLNTPGDGCSRCTSVFSIIRPKVKP